MPLPLPSIKAIAPGSELLGLHGLRGLAALAVAALHTVYIPQPYLTVPVQIGTLVSSLWHGVTLFFILSAIVLAHATAPLVGTEGWVLRYALRRFFRIAPLFYAMVAFYVVWLPYPVPASWIFANLLFVFNFHPQLFVSIVWAGWTIGIEAPFYAILPLLLSRTHKWQHAAWVLVSAVAVSIVSRYLLMTVGSLPYDLGLMSFTSNVPMFAVGLLVWHAIRDRPVTLTLQRSLMWGTLLTLATMVVVAPFPAPVIPLPPPSPRFAQLLWIIPLGLCCAWQAVSPSRLMGLAAIQWVGKRSFSCYLLHPPIVYLLANHGAYTTIQHGLHRFVGDWSILGCFLLTYIAVLPASGLIYRLIERPGQRAGHWVIDRIGRRAAVAALLAERPTGPC